MSVELNHTIIWCSDKSRSSAFLVGEAEFDAASARIEGRGLIYWADPARTKPGEINRHYGGRGLYFADPTAI